MTGVDSRLKLDTMCSVGAEHTIDYAAEDFAASADLEDGRRYDLILDVVASHSAFDYARSLLPGGRCVIVGGATSRILQAVLCGSVSGVLYTAIHTALGLLQSSSGQATAAAGQLGSLTGSLPNIQTPSGKRSIWPGNHPEDPFVLHAGCIGNNTVKLNG